MASEPDRQWFTPRGKALQRWVKIHIWVYRRTGGRVLYKMRKMPTVLLTTTGRKSGRRHTVPLPYLRDGDAPVVVGSFAGNDRHPAWVLNLQADPKVTVQDRSDVYPARAEVLTGADRAAVWERLVGQSPWYAQYQKQTTREIPLVRLDRLDRLDRLEGEG
ncbi:MAG: ddn 2 [Acidimicrobiales bacterium]|jgi:deazaflavin-dependent oxidoreductase (nitroreductase family)|nr:ddn 2 [Acidimicrobiales bacterium]